MSEPKKRQANVVGHGAQKEADDRWGAMLHVIAPDEAHSGTAIAAASDAGSAWPVEVFVNGPAREVRFVAAERAAVEEAHSVAWNRAMIVLERLGYDAVEGEPMTPEQEREMWEAGEEMEADRREALREGLQAMMLGMNHFDMFVTYHANRLTSESRFALQVVLNELHPNAGGSQLDGLYFGED